jgi:hypothetical protein
MLMNMRKPLILLTAVAAACGGGSFTGGNDGGNDTSPDAGPTSTAVIQSFTASQPSIALGATVQLTATFTGGTGVIDHQVGTVQSGVPVTVTPTANATWTLIVTDPNNVPVTASVTVLVTGAVCIGNSLLTGLGKTHMLAGVSPSVPLKSGPPDPQSAAELASWDANYLYLAGGVASGSGPCAACDSSCTNGGWWGCYNTPVGQYVKFRVSDSQSLGQIPWFTYYEILQSTGGNEFAAEVQAMNNPSNATRILADMKFMFQMIGTATAFVHVEPDFWGYAQQVNSDPTKIPVALSSFADCGTDAPTIAGFVKCIIAMARKYSPNVRIGFHGSAFATGIDVSINNKTTLDVVAEGTKLAAFLKAAGADQADFVAVDASDRDAGYYASIGNPHAWDATNATLPNFHQSFAWAQALAEGLNLPVIYWQVPVGDSAQNNTTNHWTDNRVDYFYAHPDELVAAHVAGMMFGAGRGDQTLPEGDGGNLIAKQKAYVTSGGEAVCH